MEPFTDRVSAIDCLMKVVDTLDIKTLNMVIAIAKGYAPVEKKISPNNDGCYEDEWLTSRIKELEDGDSICCSEECEGHSSAMSVLVKAAERGKKKRRARRGYSSETEESESKEPYVRPPRVSDAEKYWPYMRCKNIARIFLRINIPRSHHALLEYLASIKKVSVDELKKTHPLDYFKEYPGVTSALSHLSRY